MALDVFFADDSIQRNPARQRMGRLVAVGGIYVCGDRVNNLERRISQICTAVGFPPDQEFKWSPRRDLWMYRNLVDEARARFFSDVLQACREQEVRVTVIMSDTDSQHPVNCHSHEHFVTQLLIERIEWTARQRGQDVLIVFDQPGGRYGDEEDFLGRCLETIQSGTPFIRPRRIALNALSTRSHFVRLLQIADVMTGCSTAFVAGELRFAPPTFAVIRPMLASNMGRVGGVGIKIHPDFLYANLYHWLIGDTHYVRGNVGVPFPLNSRPFAVSPDVF